MKSGSDVFKGLAALVTTSIIWGSSFPVIKLVVGDVSSYTYVWVRSSIALAGLTPYITYLILKGKLTRRAVLGGLAAGVMYSLGLWFQGWGTSLTTASNSAFITGLNVVFVHLIEGVILRSYSKWLGLSLAVSLTGLYLLTRPEAGLNVGDLLVLISALFWATQVIIISKFSGENPLAVTYFEVLPATLFVLADLADGGITYPSTTALLGLTYLGLISTNAAFTLQVFGQRFLRPSVAATVYLLEPVAAAFFAYLIISEILTPLSYLGGALIVVAMGLAVHGSSTQTPEARA